MRIVMLAALVLVAALVAGCTSSSSPAAAQPPTAQTSAPVATSTHTPVWVTATPWTDTTEPTVQPTSPLQLTILNHDWKRTGESTWKSIYVVGAAKNSGSKRIDYGTIDVKWFDKAGNVLGTNSHMFSQLEPGETYRFEIMYIGDTDEGEVDRYTIVPGDLDNYS
jgi:hypothetical protein